MFKNLNVFSLAHSLATHAGARQAVIAQNMANADTPGYQPRDLKPFAELQRPANLQAGLKATRENHLSSTGMGSIGQPEEIRGGVLRGSNSVSIEDEMVKAVETQRQHDRAIAIYKSSLGILRTSLGRG
jgi:flagellar basal-body rod protein FlgB